MRSEKSGLDLRNSWINRDMASSLRLRDAEFAKANAETLRIGQNAELLKAQTAYEQTAIDKLLTEIDIAKIQKGIQQFDLDFKPDTWFAEHLYGNGLNNPWSIGATIMKNLNMSLSGTESKLKKYGFKFGK